MTDISVVIGFKDWGTERLVLSVESLQRSFGSLQGEVIVSDYGSKDTDGNRKLVESLGARYIYTETDGKWSRSRALNAGFQHAKGEVLVCTDADMLFTPRSMEIVGKTVFSDPQVYVLLQCRDLPQSHDHTRFSEGLIDLDWDEVDNVSRLRPRWGMGGMIAVSREAFSRVRGLDERMHTYGGEDIDFANRLQRAGYKQMWIDDESVRMYHMWHASSRKKADSNPDEIKAIEFNKNIVASDPTHIRNIANWHYRLDGTPLVSVAIATYNRANYIRDSINSVLAQTFQDFEIIIVDDGSTDNTREVIESYSDPRIKYFYQENGGISKARNRAAAESSGIYTAVHDDDDLMLPTRLATSLSAIRPGVRATFGSWVNFDDESGKLFLHVTKKKFGPETSFLTGQAPGHSTWLVETRLIRDFKYDESLSSAIDNNLALRMMRAGIKWVHTGRVLFIRRVHSAQVTETDGSNQKIAAALTKFMIHVPASVQGRTALHSGASKEPWPKLPEKDNLEEVVVKYLPDHLASRSITISGAIEDLTILIDKVADVEYLLVEKNVDGQILSQEARLRNVTWDDLVVLRRHNVDYELSAVRRDSLGRSLTNTRASQNPGFESTLTKSMKLLGGTSNGAVLYLDRNEFDKYKNVFATPSDAKLITLVATGQQKHEFALVTYADFGDAVDVYIDLKKRGAVTVSVYTDNPDNNLRILDEIVSFGQGKY